MSDGLILDEEKIRQPNAPTSQIPTANADRAVYDNSANPYSQTPLPGYQAAFYGSPNPQGGSLPPAMSYSPANQPNYVVSPLHTPAPGQMSGYPQGSSYVASPPQTPQPQPGHIGGYPVGYQQPLPHYGQAIQLGYSNNSQPQPQYDPSYQEFLLWKQQQQHQHQYGQPGQTPYSAPQQQIVYPPPPFYGASDEKQVALPPSSASEASSASKQVLPYQQTQALQHGPPYQLNQQISSYQSGPSNQQVPPYQPASANQIPPYQPPPSSLGPEIVNVPFKPVTLHGDDQHHAVKQMLKAGGAAVMLSAILGTYLHHKRQKEHQRLNNSFLNDSTTHSTQQVAMYNHLMDKLESLSGNVLTEHRHAVNAVPWQEALHPHRRAVFADLYNSNENVRGFCSDFPGGPTAFPQMDEYSLGMRKPNLSFQRAGRQAPNWNAARDLLGQVRTVILLDDSRSMGSPGHAAWDNADGYDDWGGSNRRSTSRWDQAHELIAGIAPLVSRHNRHGIDLHFLNHRGSFLGLRSSPDVHHVFNTVHPSGGTPTGRRVNEILNGYMCVLRYNRSLPPLNLIVVTDGEAQDENLLHRAIEEHVTKIVHRGFRAHQFGIEFLQVGDDWEATRHLERLEEEVSRHHHSFQRDVVGVTPASRQRSMTPDKLLGIVLSGIDARMNGYMRHRGVDV